MYDGPAITPKKRTIPLTIFSGFEIATLGGPETIVAF